MALWHLVANKPPSSRPSPVAGPLSRQTKRFLTSAPDWKDWEEMNDPLPNAVPQAASGSGHGDSIFDGVVSEEVVRDGCLSLDLGL